MSSQSIVGAPHGRGPLGAHAMNASLYGANGIRIQINVRGHLFTVANTPRDAEAARWFRRADGRMREGMCPNGCGAMVHVVGARHQCPVCAFWLSVYPKSKEEPA